MRLGYRGTLPIALALAAALVSGSISAHAAKEDDDSKFLFSPEAEKKLAEFFEKAKDVKRGIWESRMRTEIESVEKSASLSIESRKTLDAAATMSIQACLDGWIALMDTAFREQYAGQADQALNFFDQLSGQVETYARTDSWFASDATQPEENSAWTAALRQVLPSDQLAAAENAGSEKRRAIGREIVEFLKATEEMARQQQGAVFMLWGDEVKSWLTMSNERAEQLDALVKVVTDENAETVRKRAEKWLLFAEDEQRVLAIKQGRMYARNNVRDLKAQRARWNEGLARVLPAEDLKHIQEMQSDMKARRAVALGKVLLNLLDERLALTVEQREKLRPIADRLVLSSPYTFPVNETQNYSPSVLLSAATKASEEELKTILDARQIERWREIGAQRSGVVRQIATAEAQNKFPDDAEPEEIGRILSDFLNEKTTTERKRVLAMNLLKVEDATRIAKPTPEVVRRLETAARGATEEMLIPWKTSMEMNARNQGQSGSPDSLRTLMANLRNTSFTVARDGAVDTDAVWERTLKAELTEAQRAVWQKEIDARGVCREKAIIGMVMSAFTRRTALKIEQWDKLEPLVLSAINKYGQDIASMFSSSNWNQWYLQTYTMLTPLLGVPEDQLKEILGKEQWERWTSSREYANSLQYWKSVQSNHARRVEKPKQ